MDFGKFEFEGSGRFEGEGPWRSNGWGFRVSTQ